MELRLLYFEFWREPTIFNESGCVVLFKSDFPNCMSDPSTKLTLESWLVSAGRSKNPGQPLNVAPTLASNYVLGGDYVYSRDDGTPAVGALEEIVGVAEKGKTVAFSSGMAAITAVFNLLKADSTIVLPDDCYQGVAGLAVQGMHQGRWKLERLPVIDTEGWIKACEYADLIWLESPSNPLLEIADLKAICGAKRKTGAILGVDNTFASHINQQPLDLGADISIQSATKFIGGHSDLLCGVASTNKDILYEGLRSSRVLLGATPGAFEVYLAIRGIRTMHLRLERAQENAMVLAERLESHTNVSKVRYPGLSSHPNHGVAKNQLGGFGTIISFDTKGESEYADTVCKSLNLIQHATSLGAVESTIERRAAIPGQEHLPATLLRLSVGVENVEDLWNDLDQALN